MHRQERGHDDPTKRLARPKVATEIGHQRQHDPEPDQIDEYRQKDDEYRGLAHALPNGARTLAVRASMSKEFLSEPTRFSVQPPSSAVVV